MIQSILDNDLYKFSMQQAVHTLYPRAEAEYAFINRGKTLFPDALLPMLRDQVDAMAGITLSPAEKKYLEDTCYFLTPVYLDFLESYRFDPDEVHMEQDTQGFRLRVKGPWYRTILWEIPLMAMISELYFSIMDFPVFSREEIRKVNQKKAEVMKENGICFSDFGTRRRYSAQNHENMIADVLDYEGNTLIGTSNVHFARKFHLIPMGTLAHEWFMFHAVMSGYQMANITAQDAWVRVYQGNLGIALTDTYTTDVFLSGFDTLHAKLFDGVRHDSGDPLAFLDKIVAHYKNHHIDPGTKTIVFSDGLDVNRAVSIHEHCKGRIRDTYGIGTNLTNDVGVEPLNMVIKLSRTRPFPERPFQYTIKLSDDPGKITGDPGELENCLRILNVKPSEK